MTEEAYSRLGPLYHKIGMSPSQDLVAGRIASAKKIYEQIDEDSLVPLLRGVFGLAKGDELDFIHDALAADDPLYASDGREAQLISSALLRRVLEEGDNYSSLAALGVAVASCGGLRSAIDDDLVAHAQRIISARRLSRKSLPDKITYKTKPNWSADFEALQPFVDGGQFREAYPGLRKLLEGSATYSQSTGSHIVSQVQALLESQKHLAEQMEVHWWVLGAWSIEAESPFSKMPAPEAGMRAGMDLATLSTASKFGLFSAPALIAQALGEAVGDTETSLKELALSGARDWRSTWSRSLLEKAELMSLLPVSGAVCLAIDSDEQPDWEPRYARQLQIDAASALSVRDAAVQLYLEQLFRREVEA